MQRIAIAVILLVALATVAGCKNDGSSNCGTNDPFSANANWNCDKWR